MKQNVFFEKLDIFLKKNIGKDWHYNFEYDSETLFIKMNIWGNIEELNNEEGDEENE